MFLKQRRFKELRWNTFDWWLSGRELNPPKSWWAFDERSSIVEQWFNPLIIPSRINISVSRKTFLLVAGGRKIEYRKPTFAAKWNELQAPPWNAIDNSQSFEVRIFEQFYCSFINKWERFRRKCFEIQCCPTTIIFSG